MFRTVRNASVEIEIAAAQVERFRQAQTGSGDQPEDRRVGGRPQSALRGQGAKRRPGGRRSPALNRCAARGGDVNGRRLRSEGTRWPGSSCARYLANGRRTSRRRAQENGAGSLGLALHPVQDDLVGERAAMAALVGELGEGGDLMALPS